MNRGRGGWRGGRGGRGGWRGRGGSSSGGQRAVPTEEESNSNAETAETDTTVAVHRRAAHVVANEPEVPRAYGWNVYFPTTDFTEDGEVMTYTGAFLVYFRTKEAIINKESVELHNAIFIDFQELLTECVGALAAVPEDLHERPSFILACMGMAAYQSVYLNEHGQPYSARKPPRLNVHIFNYDKVIQLRKLKSNSIGRFLCVRGTVVRVSNIRPLVTKMGVICSKCLETQCLHLLDGKYVPPTKCTTPGCKGKTFAPDYASAVTETIDWQTVRVQEIITDDSADAGRIPRTIECELMADLVDSCVPGDVVTVTGEVKVTASPDGKNAKNMFLLYILANSISNARSNTSGSVDIMEFSVKDFYAINEIQNQPNLFRLIVNSICPAIYGHEIVKAGIVLALFGGVHRYADDKNRIPVRGDPHVLIVGDPGLGKSQILQAVTNIMPRGVYVCGNTTTTSGLTVTLLKDSASGDYALEAGALVLGDQGCCCIDEFDKMGQEHQALLEAMEQQSISVAKAGIVCSLPARTSIIAAANPVGGHYNKAKTVSENLKMGSALLSRFDLVFILLDKPDEEMDRLLSEHVMALHNGRMEESRRARISAAEIASQTSQAASLGAEKPLIERLKYPNLDSPIPAVLLRKYVAYARKYVQPKLSVDASRILQDFYINLRRKFQSQDSTPITTRQLESLIRLSEARARLELRERVTAQDAQDVIDIMRESMSDVFTDDLGNLDFKRSQNGSGVSRLSLVKRFVAVLNKEAEQNFNTLFSMDQLRQIGMQHHIKPADLNEFIDLLNTQGYLLRKGPRQFQLQTIQ